MSDYGDVDPEDAYDATDEVWVRMHVLERIVAAVEADRTPRRDVRRLDAIRVAGDLAAEPSVDRIRLAIVFDELEAM